MSGSVLRGTFSATRTMGKREIAALRPATAPPVRQRKPAAPPREVTSGIVCFCGEQFAESQALEFMLHLRAEVGEDLALLERMRTYKRELVRKYRKDPEYRERVNERNRERRKDPEYRKRRNERRRERYKDPEYRERISAQHREYRARRKQQALEASQQVTP